MHTSRYPVGDLLGLHSASRESLYYTRPAKGCRLLLCFATACDMLPPLRSLLLIITWRKHHLSWSAYSNTLAWFGPEYLEKCLRLQIIDDKSHAVTAVMGRTAEEKALVLCGSAGHQPTLCISAFAPARTQI